MSKLFFFVYLFVIIIIFSCPGPTILNGYLHGLPPGHHGFHVHAAGDTRHECNSAGMTITYKLRRNRGFVNLFISVGTRILVYLEFFFFLKVLNCKPYIGIDKFLIQSINFHHSNVFMQGVILILITCYMVAKKTSIVMLAI